MSRAEAGPCWISPHRYGFVLGSVEIYIPSVPLEPPSMTKLNTQSDKLAFQKSSLTDVKATC